MAQRDIDFSILTNKLQMFPEKIGAFQSTGAFGGKEQFGKRRIKSHTLSTETLQKATGRLISLIATEKQMFGSPLKAIFFLAIKGALRKFGAAESIHRRKNRKAAICCPLRIGQNIQGKNPGCQHRIGFGNQRKIVFFGQIIKYQIPKGKQNMRGRRIARAVCHHKQPLQIRKGLFRIVCDGMVDDFIKQEQVISLVCFDEIRF